MLQAARDSRFELEARPADLVVDVSRLDLF
jgi:hypothetical protein